MFDVPDQLQPALPTSYAPCHAFTRMCRELANMRVMYLKYYEKVVKQLSYA